MKMNVKVGVATLGIATLCAGWMIYQKSSGAEQKMSVASSAAVHPSPAGVGGLVVTVDPSGRPIQGAPQPPAPPQTPQEQNASSTSSDGLVQVPRPGGGVTMDLQGRFQNPLVATIGADGKVTMEHVNDLPHAAK